MMKKKIQLYLHIPFCIKKCHYCDFLSFSADEDVQEEYVDALIREIEYYGSCMQEYEVSTIFIGGGTPSWLNERKMLQIIAALHRNFSICEDAEITMECNPGTITAKKMQQYRKAGINRLSIGLQSADNEELKILGRIHTYEQFLKTFSLAREADFTNVNVDLISGIPYQTREKFLNTLQKVVWLKPEHISAYSLIIEEGTPFYDAYKNDRMCQEKGLPTQILPSEEETYAILKMTQQYLKDAGYKQYETSNFSLKGYECRHNVGYWTRKEYLGMGIGAASLVDNVRFSNETDLEKYIENTKLLKNRPLNEETENMIIGTILQKNIQTISRAEQMEEFMFLGLRMNEGVGREEFKEHFGTSIDAVYRSVMDELKAEGLVQLLAGRVALTERGSEVANYVMSRFLLR